MVIVVLGQCTEEIEGERATEAWGGWVVEVKVKREMGGRSLVRTVGRNVSHGW